MRILFNCILCFCLVAVSAGEQANDPNSTSTITPSTITVTTTTATTVASTPPTAAASTAATTAASTAATTAASTAATTAASTAATTAATTPATTVASTPATTAASTPATTPASTPVTTPATTPVTTPATTPVTTPATTPVTTPATTPVTTPATTPVTTPATTPVTTPATTPVTTPATTPVTTPATTPVTTPATTPVTTPATTPVTTPVTTPATTKGPCTPNPCIGNGICEKRDGENFVCTCKFGLTYDNTSGCIPAKVFPGDLILKQDFEDAMADKTSESFRKTAENIQKQLRDALQADASYLYSIVLSLKRGSIVAEVQNFYSVLSNATTESVRNLINQAIEEGTIADALFETKSVCDLGSCDNTTTTCNGDGIAECTCLDGYIKSEFTTRICVSCPYGEKSVGPDTCKKCDFGFSGLNCKDPYLLVVVVVSCVLGTLMIVFGVALIVVSSRKQKVNSSQSKEDFSVEMHKPAGVPRIPRVKPTSDWQPANMEVFNSGSTEALVTKSLRDNKARYATYDNDSDDGRQKNHEPSVYGGVRVMENGLRGNQNPYDRQDENRMRRY